MSAAVTGGVRLRVEDEPTVERHSGLNGSRFRLYGGRRVENVTTGEAWFECMYCGQRSDSAWGISVHRGRTHPEAPKPATTARAIRRPRNAPRSTPAPAPAPDPSPAPMAAAPAFPEEPASAEDELTERATALLGRLHRLAFRARSAETEADEWRQRALNAEAAARALRENRHE